MPLQSDFEDFRKLTRKLEFITRKLNEFTKCMQRVTVLAHCVTLVLPVAFINNLRLITTTPVILTAKLYWAQRKPLFALKNA
jgi:hypothetical protein